jgi:anti-sigma factor RsiW
MVDTLHKMIDCPDMDDRIEEMADGLTPDAEAAAHLSSCARCQARLRLAQSMNRVLDTREVPEPPAWFTSTVMTRVHRERWRSEQLVDAGFNIAIAAGLALIVAGLGALAWSLGWFSIDQAAVQVVVEATGRWLARISEQLQMLVVAAVLLTSALGLWWWVEGERSF